MLSPKAQLNLKHAKAYFREHLSVGDYYSVEAQVRGEWFGQAAARLGLTGAVGEAEFLALCDGRNPRTGERLTQRLNSTRLEVRYRAVKRQGAGYMHTSLGLHGLEPQCVLFDESLFAGFEFFTNADSVQATIHLP